MTTLKDLQNELEKLEKALKNKLITVNEYCSFYYQVSQKIKAL
jgi:hypothetical protein